MLLTPEQRQLPMQKYRYIKAAIIGFSMAFVVAGPTMLLAETLRVLRADVSAAINVPIGGTVVFESGHQYYDEITIANPGIADISALSEQLFAVIGVSSGRTTLTVLGRQDRIANVEILVAPNMPEFDETNPVSIPNMPPAEVIPVLDGVAAVTITVPSSGAVVVETDVPFDGLEMGNPDIADISAFSNSTVYLLGKDVGRTTLTFHRNDGQPATVLQVCVAPTMEDSNNPLCSNIPHSALEGTTYGIPIRQQIKI